MDPPWFLQLERFASGANRITSKAVSDIVSHRPGEAEYDRTARILASVCIPKGEWIWTKLDHTDPRKWEEQEDKVNGLNRLVKWLCEFVGDAYGISDAGPVVPLLICYSQPGYPWVLTDTPEKVSTTLRNLAVAPDKQCQTIFESHVKPAFANPTRPGVSSAGRQAPVPIEPKFVTNVAEKEYRKPWRVESQWTLVMIEWALRNSGEEQIARYWSILVPSILNIVDDYEIAIKAKGCILASELLKITDASFFLNTGLLPVFWDAVKPCLLYLPPSTTVEQSITIIPSAIAALTSLANVSVRAGKPWDEFDRRSKLSQIVRDGIVKGISQAGEKIKLTQVLLVELTRLVPVLGVLIVRHLRQVTLIFVKILCDPFASLFQPLVVSACHMLNTVIQHSEDRIEGHKYEVLRGLVTARSLLQKEGEMSDETDEALRSCLNELKQVIRVDVLKGDILRLVEYDPSLRDYLS